MPGAVAELEVEDDPGPVGVWPQGCAWGLPPAPEETLHPIEDMDVMVEYQRRPARPAVAPTLVEQSRSAGSPVAWPCHRGWPTPEVRWRLKGSPLWAAGRHGVQDAGAARVPRGPGRRPRPAACAQRCCVKWRASCQHFLALRYCVHGINNQDYAFYFPVR